MPEFFELPGDIERLYAIGDIHGCAAELELLLSHLRNSEKLTKNDCVIFIGDYIDRGPSSKEVVSKLIDFKKEFERAVFLKGNHEDMLLSYLGYPGRAGDVYMVNGGETTLESYGVSATDLLDKIKETIGEEHMKFYLQLQRYAVGEEYVFVHAGLDPLRALSAQIDDDLFWIRDEFILNIHHFDKTVVFGHTPYEEIIFHRPFKIGIDTGLVFGNKLSCVELRDKRVLQVSRGAQQVAEGVFPKE